MLGAAGGDRPRLPVWLLPLPRRSPNDSWQGGPSSGLSLLAGCRCRGIRGSAGGSGLCCASRHRSLLLAPGPSVTVLVPPPPPASPAALPPPPARCQLCCRVWGPGLGFSLEGPCQQPAGTESPVSVTRHFASELGMLQTPRTVRVAPKGVPHSVLGIPEPCEVQELGGHRGRSVPSRLLLPLRSLQGAEWGREQQDAGGAGNPPQVPHGEPSHCPEHLDTSAERDKSFPTHCPGTDLPPVPLSLSCTEVEILLNAGFDGGIPHSF